jgi:similar to stage IV sporulation protein
MKKMKFLKILYLYTFGYVDIKVEGFFTERFVNLCFAKGIFLWRLTRTSSIEVTARISLKDFKRIRKIAKTTKCKVKVASKKGLPFLLNRYKKRKIFAITFLVVAILIFGLTRFVWNIEVVCEDKEVSNEILKILEDNGIKEGVAVSKIDTQKAINNICINCDEVSWVGIKIDGTCVIVSVELETPKPEILDSTTPCDIISDKEGIIKKITVLNGTAVAKVGDTVSLGDTLVRGIIEGKYTDTRTVHAVADIIAEIYYTKEAEENFEQEYYELTENTYNNFSVKFNNFEINFNKRLPNFKNYDTIETNKKIKIFSNIYLPIVFKKTTYKEKNLKQKVYTTEELSDELQEKLKLELLEENNILEENVTDVTCDVTPTDTGVKVKITCIVTENIGIEQSTVS